MPRFVMLSTLGPNGSATLQEQPDRVKAVNLEVEAMGVRVLDQYALLGPYDFLTILDAPDELTMAKLATNLGARGTMKCVTLTAIPVDEFVERMRTPE